MNGFNFSDASEIYFGSTKAKEVYYGSTKIWGGEEHDYSKDYLTIEFLESGKLQVENYSSAPIVTFEYSEDNGTTWNSITTVLNTVLDVGGNHVAGDKILLKGNNGRYGGGSASGNAFCPTGKFNLYGNVMSLLYGDNFVGQDTITEIWAFACMFIESPIVSAKNLILPATTLTNGCYGYMFDSCEELIEAPQLPATTIETRCYIGMFEYCPSLTKAPDLPAKNLLAYCYRYMFRQSPNVTYIKCLAETTTTTNATNQWLAGGSATGTFVKSANATFWASGISGIPSGWTVESE